MRKKALATIRSPAEARQIAIDWQHWQSNQDLSYYELMKWHSYFLALAKRFKLTREFKENCII